MSGNDSSRRKVSNKAISNEFDNLARSMLDVNAVQKRVQQQLGKGFNFDEGKFAADSFIQKLQYLATISGGLKDQYNQAQMSQIMAKAATMDDAHAQEYLALQLAKGNSAFLHMVGGAAAFIPALILLSGKSKTYTDILKQMQNPADVVTAAFNNMRNTLGQSLKMLEIRFQNILIVIGLQIIPVVTSFAKSLMGAVDGVMAFVQSSNGLEIMKQGLIGLGTILAVIVVPAIISMVAAAAPFTLMMGAMAFVSIKLGAILEQHPEIVAKAQQAFTSFGNTMRGLWNLLQPLLAQLGRALHDALTNPGLIAALHNLGAAIMGLGPVVRLLAIAVGAVLFVAFTVLIKAVQLVAPLLTLVANGFALVLTVAGNVARVITSNEVAFTALKAVLIAVGVAMGVNMVEDLMLLAGKLLFLIPLLWAQAEAWVTTAVAAVIAELPIYLLIAAIALLAFGILELVQHWTQVKAFFSNIGHAVGELLSLFGVLIGKGLGELGQAFGAVFGFIGQVIDDFCTLTPNKIAYAIGYVIGFFLGLQVRAAQIIIHFVASSLGAIGRFATALPAQLQAMAMHAAVVLAIWADQTLIKLQVMVVQAGIAIGKWVHNLPADLLLMATNAGIAIGKMKDQVILNIIKLVADGEQALQKLVTDAPFIIGQFILGLIHGIANGLGAVKDAIGSFAGGVVDGFKNALGIHSPSTIMMAMGMNLSQGLINGFKSIDVASAWMQHTAALTTPLTPVYAGAASPAGVGAAGNLAFAGASGGGGVHTYNISINAATPAAAAEAKKQFETWITEHELQTAQRSKRAGFAGGLRAGY